MEKTYKIILSCVCVALVFTLLGFGIGRMTDTAPATDTNQNINANHSESETTGKVSEADLEAMEAENDGVEVRFQDGSTWKIIVDPSVQSVLGDDFDWSDYDIGFTDDHE